METGDKNSGANSEASQREVETRALSYKVFPLLGQFKCDCEAKGTSAGTSRPRPTPGLPRAGRAGPLFSDVHSAGSGWAWRCLALRSPLAKTKSAQFARRRPERKSSRMRLMDGVTVKWGRLAVGRGIAPARRVKGVFGTRRAISPGVGARVGRVDAGPQVQPGAGIIHSADRNVDPEQRLAPLGAACPEL